MSQTEQKKYEYLDSLRGIAILMVMFVHVGLMFFSSTIPFIFNGRLGVQLFFLVSAYTLTMSYQNRKEEKHRNRSFFIRRFFRIAPMYYAATIFYILHNGMEWNFGNINLISLKTLLSTISFTNTLFPDVVGGYVPGGWSISIEFLFYILFPFICLKVKNLNSSIIFYVATVLLALLYSFSIFFFKVSNDNYIHDYNILFQLPVFALGILTYRFLNDTSKDIKPSTYLLVALLIIILNFTEAPYYLIFSIAFALLLITLYIKEYKFLSNKILARIGRVSFSMYLIHFAIIDLAFKFNYHQYITIYDTKTKSILLIIFLSIVSIITYLVSTITYKYIEVPGQNLGRKLIKTLDQR